MHREKGCPKRTASFHLAALWITESQRERAESLGYTVVDLTSARGIIP